jgi:endonuclease V-like protein UPF0215 family
LCSAHRHYNERSPDYYIRTAGKKSAVLAEIITGIFNSARPPEVFYRTCDGLLSLSRKTDPVRFEKACQTALDNNMFSYRFIKSLVENNSLLIENEVYKPLPLPQQNIRGSKYYQ